ncbi:MAG: DUF5009 domain-containing protein [Gemmataceae bacterium]
MSTAPTASPPPVRLTSLDAYRGLVMFLMMAEVLRLAAVAAAVPDSAFWRFLAYHQSHVEWVGLALHDLIQPSFSFLVGAALPFSLAGRAARGQSRRRMVLHAVYRAAVLVLLGIFLRSIGSPTTNFTFVDTLTQIGLGYPLLFLLGLASVRVQWVAFVAILVGYWALFALYPLPGPEFDWAKAGVAADWPYHLDGFAAHWNKNTNPAAAFDVWFLNLFPRQKPFLFSDGGYTTLNFVPTLATMILGLLAGGVLRSERTARQKLAWLVGAGLVTLVIGYGLGEFGIVPVVKRIWTPSWVLYSGGWCLLLTAAFYAVLDVAGRRGWAFPLVVIGMNSIAAYCMAWLFKGFISAALRRHLGAAFQAFGTVYEPLLLGGATLLVLWLLLYTMYRRGLFLRI